MESLVDLPREVKVKAVNTLVERAKSNSDSFCEFVLKDEKGNNIKQSQIHREINWHIDECRRLKLNCGILAPWGHGKTEQVVISRTLQFIGEDPNNRVSIVCNSDDNAALRVESIGRYIERDSDYHLVYPHVRPGDSSQWGRHNLVVERKSLSKDGSVTAWGITTSGTGSRCDFLIVDDPVDLRNAILNPALRPQVKESFRNVWSSRLAPDGFKIYIATVWHDDDLTSEIAKDPEWCFLIIKVSEDFSSLDCESPLKGKFNIPLWEEKWNKERLIKKFKDIKSRAFNRGYRQQAMSNEDRTFPSASRIFHYDISKDIVSKDWPRVMGVDPFGQWVVLFTLAVNPANGRRYPIDIRRGKWQPNETVSQIIEAYATHRHQIIVCENNASQTAIEQWVRERGHASIPIIGFTTTSAKADPRMGLPSIEVEFANDSWCVPMGKMHEPDCGCGFCVWRSELHSHPIGVTADTIMASWFAREGARYLMSPIEGDREEIVTQEDIGIEPVKIGSY